MLLSTEMFRRLCTGMQDLRKGNYTIGTEVSFIQQKLAEIGIFLKFQISTRLKLIALGR